MAGYSANSGGETLAHLANKLESGSGVAFVRQSAVRAIKPDIGIDTCSGVYGLDTIGQHA